MRTRFDELGKQIGRAALGTFGATVAQHAISPETQYADLHYEPDPARAAERELLGLLGRIARPCSSASWRPALCCSRPSWS